ncbi:MAG: peptidylprolyl isomerase [Akkermansiaceae bacterium]|jgi:peptidyl-prolyl cis-trans isomerase A (cyclophilin A)
MKPLLTLFFVGLLSTFAFAQEKEKAEAVEKAPAPEEVTVIMSTSEGNIHIELNSAKAPITVANFLTYVDKKAYDGTVFHRVISDFMIQGGGFTLEGESLKKAPVAGKPIKNESPTSGSNTRGTISMARTPDPDSATNQFFINVANNDGTEAYNLDFPHSAGHGYATFGKVSKGLDVVDKIKAVETGVINGMGDVPKKTVLIKSIKRAK